MKKRILYVLLSSLILCSCGHEQSASDKALTNAKKAYEIGQNYLSGDISAEDAQEQLENIEENISYASDYSYDERKNDTQKSADYHLHNYVYFLSLDVMMDKGDRGDADSYDKVKDSVKKLKEQIDKYD